ncbi:MAG: alpha-amylase family glycosyl hydrolase [Verrucomicrobiota bacterium]
MAGLWSMQPVHHPLLYQVNTRVWLQELSRRSGRPATLDDVPEDELDRWRDSGFDWVWLLGVWRLGRVGPEISRSRPEWHHEFIGTLPDLGEADIGGSCFAIVDYGVADGFGGEEALARFRARLARRRIRLMLDFVPNHVAIDHPWVGLHPDWFIAGTAADLERSPANFIRLPDGRILAHGRDPYFPGWPDTLQLDYSQPGLREAMASELVSIAGRCDGVRCDMAMLLLPEVFARTWGRSLPAFWPGAIRGVREARPDFLFMAEVYWDLEWTLQQQGFDACYDKRLYDRVCHGDAASIRAHLSAGLDYQDRLARFLENHDEPRAAAVVPFERHRAAAALTFLSPGLRFLHQGQDVGRRIRVSPHLIRAPEEAVDEALRSFYADLLATLRLPVVREGSWQLLHSIRAWEGNPTSEDLIGMAWTGRDGSRLVVAVNFSEHAAQGFLGLPWEDLDGGHFELRDRLGPWSYDRDGGDLLRRGLYLDVPAWRVHVFDVTRIG